MKKALLFIIFILSVPAVSQDVYFPSSSGTRGDQILLPLIIEGVTPESSAEITFEFNALMLDASSLSFSENTLGSEQSTTLELQYDSDAPRTSGLIIKFSDINDIVSDTLCFLNLEILAGPDTLANITASDVIIDDENISAEFTTSEIRIIDPVELIPDNIVGDVYPNPSSGEARADLFLNVPTQVTVSIYNIQGKKVLRALCGDCEGQYVEIFNSMQMPVEKDAILEPGDYTIKLVDQSNSIGSGAYILIVTTDNQVLNKKFMILK